MSRGRVLLLSAVTVLLIVGSLFCIVFDTEYWPFSQYPMFSRVYDNSLSGLRLYGVTQEKPHREILLTAEGRGYIAPLGGSRLHHALAAIESKHDLEKRQKHLNKALVDCLKRYEKLRRAGRHDGPPLQGVRLYEERWHFEAGAENAESPDHLRLIAELEKHPGD